MGPPTPNLDGSKAKEIYSLHPKAYRQDSIYSLKRKKKKQKYSIYT